MTTEPGIAPRATTHGPWRRGLKVTLVFVAVVAIAIYLFLGIDNTSGGPSYPWDRAMAGARWFLRELWAGFTGRSIHEDLFP